MDDIDEILLRLKDEKRSEEESEIVLQPFAYINCIPGKKIRKKLALAVNHYLDVPVKVFRLIGDVVDKLHIASLLIDDIEDNSPLRRGVPAAHTIYGIKRSITSALYILYVCLNDVHRLPNPDAIKVFTEQLIELHRGQGIDIHWRDTFTPPTETEYKLMIMQKTGGLFTFCVKLMQMHSTSKKDLTNLTSLLGVYFQIRDDYCNLRSKEYSDNKSFCEDITEGKFSFPVIHAIQNPKIRTQVMDILKQHTEDVEVKKHCIALLEEAGSLKYTADVLASMDRDARAELKRLGPNPFFEELFDELLTWKLLD